MERILAWTKEHKRSALALALIGGLVVPIFAACATIMHGSSQDIAFASQPSGAEVYVDNSNIGETPVSEELSRGSEHSVRIELEGYEPYEMQITNSVSGWVAGNIIFGGVIGLAVDWGTGSLYKLSPKQVDADLSEAAADFSAEDGDLYVKVTLQPKDDWEKIGQLHHK